MEGWVGIGMMALGLILCTLNAYRLGCARGWLKGYKEGWEEGRWVGNREAAGMTAHPDP